SARLYRTGDRVRRRADGNIEFLGRVDRQVKINGKRVELDEIEACLRRSPDVEDAAVASPIDDNAPRKVHAYVKLRAGASASAVALRQFMKQEAADHMIPATFTLMDELPLSPTGKVDRSKLPRPHLDPPPGAATPPPAGNETETLLLEIWRKVLGLERVGLNDNFFDLGGTSLQLVQIHATIAEIMPSDLSVVDLFQYPSIRALAAHLAPNAAGAAPGSAAGHFTGGALTAAERARRQQRAMARARTNQRRVHHD
ncbi:MAG TPA: phosphopantetheine-binding protein, partial [Steroidobacteraceae bacterium]|nr:phosphopantetheine-binding protein [Steroidobacteraceae bacterium]